MAEHGRRTVRDLRRGNRTAVLRRLYFEGPLSRQALGPATGLSSGSISNVVAELTGEGLLEEAGVIESEGGRPRTLLRVAAGSACLIGVDIGETRVRVGLFDLALNELARAELPLTRQGHDAGVVAGHVGECVAGVLRSSGADPAALLGVGVGVPGIVERDAERGAVVHGQTVGWDAVPLEERLRASVELPAEVPYFVGNGAKALGQAEMWFGGGRGVQDAVVVLLGSGVGACVVTGGADRGGADEWGHLTVDLRGRRCRCGARGCLEAYTGSAGLLERWREAGGAPPADDEEAGLCALLSAAYPGDGRPADASAVAVLDETAEYLGAGISGLVNLFSPERVLIGGWAGLRIGPHLLRAVRRHAAAHSLRYPAERVAIELGRLGADAVTVGAATLPLAAFFAEGGRMNPAPRTGRAGRTGGPACRVGGARGAVSDSA